MRLLKISLLALLVVSYVHAQDAGDAAELFEGRPDVDKNLGPNPVTPGAETLQPRTFREFRAEASQDWPSLLLAGYLTNAQLGQWTADFVSRCSSIARRFSIGKSTNGVDLWVVELSSKPGVVEAKPNFRYVANMHGDETSGRMLLPMMAEWLCANRASDARAARIIDNMHLFLMPTMNPDGFTANSRANGAGLDLNRNFPSTSEGSCRNREPELCPPATLTQTKSSTQPETRAMMAWLRDANWPHTFAANMHEGAVCTNYPWDGYIDGTERTLKVLHASPDHAAYQHLSKVYSTSHAFMSRSSAFRDGITNGAQWYPIYGSLQDWSYTAAGCMEITLELNQQKRPAASKLPTLWEENRNAMINLPIAAALGGISGTVVSSTGAPLTGAVVTVSGNSMATAARGPKAYFNKPSAPGTYTVTASAPGYKSVSATVVVPSTGAGGRRDFVLTPA